MISGMELVALETTGPVELADQACEIARNAAVALHQKRLMIKRDAHFPKNLLSSVSRRRAGASAAAAFGEGPLKKVQRVGAVLDELKGHQHLRREARTGLKPLGKQILVIRIAEGRGGGESARAAFSRHQSDVGCSNIALLYDSANQCDGDHFMAVQRALHLRAHA